MHRRTAFGVMAAGLAGTMARLTEGGTATAQTVTDPLADVVMQDMDSLTRLLVNGDGDVNHVQSLITGSRVLAMTFDNDQLQQQLETAIAVAGGVDNLAADIVVSRTFEQELQAAGYGSVPVPSLSMSDARDAISRLREEGLTGGHMRDLRDMGLVGVDNNLDPFTVPGLTVPDDGTRFDGPEDLCPTSRRRQCQRSLQIAADQLAVASALCAFTGPTPPCKLAMAYALSYYATTRWLCRDC